jgi:hypothetical protein
MIVTGPDNTPRGPHRMIGATLQGRRMQAGITLRRMAEACGMTMTELSRVEQGWSELTWQQRAVFDGECERKHMEKQDGR